jgi:hypothetical protein
MVPQIASTNARDRLAPDKLQYRDFLPVGGVLILGVALCAFNDVADGSFCHAAVVNFRALWRKYASIVGRHLAAL